MYCSFFKCLFNSEKTQHFSSHPGSSCSWLRITVKLINTLRHRILIIFQYHFCLSLMKWQMQCSCYYDVSLVLSVPLSLGFSLSLLSVFFPVSKYFPFSVFHLSVSIFIFPQFPHVFLFLFYLSLPGCVTSSLFVFLCHFAWRPVS